MTNEEAKAFLDNLKICINEHPIVADWLVEIADRKTEPSETMSCEECKHYGTNYPCELDFKACRYEPKTEPQYSEDDMYWLSLVEDVANGKMSDAGANQAWLEYINHKTEPQTERSE